jgi:hypothetical protein
MFRSPLHSSSLGDMVKAPSLARKLTNLYFSSHKGEGEL